MAAGERQPLVDRQGYPPLEASPVPGPFQHRPGSQARGVAAGVAGQIGMAGIEDLDARPFTPLGSHRVAFPRQRQSEDIQPGADVAYATRSKRRDPRGLVFQEPANLRMSLSTPAAVTSAPAPGPVITSGLA